jgi:hypothetical protein
MQVQGEEFPTVEKFMAKYRLDAPAALERKVFRSSQPHFFSEPAGLKSSWMEHKLVEIYHCLLQCCGSGIRCFFDPWILDPE